MNEKPTVLVIDDEDAAKVPVAQERDDGIMVEIVHPIDINEDLITAAHLILLDYNLGTWWPPETSIASRPTDGLALMSIIGAHLRRLEHRHNGFVPKPVALTLISGQLGELAPSDIVPHHHLVARAYGLEWAFGKRDPDLDHQIGILAKAVCALPDDWPNEPERAEATLRALLALDEDSDEDSAHSFEWEDVLRTTPPLYELSRATDGIAIVRWLLHRIMPYPTFLWSTHQLAARLRVKHVWLREQMESAGPPSELAKLFAPARYRGILADFLGPRWWGSGIDRIVWQGTSSEAFANHALHKWLASEINSDPAVIDFVYPAICLDEKYVPEPELADMDDCVRILRDDWPWHAEPAYIRRELALDNPEMLCRVFAEDREQLGQDSVDTAASAGEVQ